MSTDRTTGLLRRASWRGISLRWLLLISLTTLVIATMALVSVSVLGIVKQNAEGARAIAAEALARSAASLEDVDALNQWLEAGTIVGYALIVDGEGGARKPLEVNGRLRRESARSALDDLASQTVTSRVHKEDNHRVVVAAASGAAGKRVVVALSMEQVDKQILGAQGLVLIHLLLVAGVVLLLGYVLLTRSVARPLQRLLDATRRVTDGDLDTRIAVGGLGEVAQLSAHFNAMLDAVQEARIQAEERLDELAQANKSLQRAQDEVQLAQDRLIRSEKLASVGQLSAGVAHEIGNPLASVLAYLELLGDEDTTPDEADDIRDKMREALRRIHRIIRELLDYSRASEPTNELLDPVLAVQQAVRLVEPQPRLRGVELQTDLDCELPEVAGDEGKLVQLLVNLMLNAADAVDGEGTICITGKVDDNALILDVTDTGPGIPDELLPHIFEPFFTTKEPGKGLGLGLAVSERIAERLGGELRIEPTERGCTLRVRLPLAPPLLDEDP